MDTIKRYYQLTKPGIIYGNLLTAAAGFLLASRGRLNYELFAGLLSGTALVIASACVINNYLDRTIDKKMKRTQKRALASGTMRGPTALVYAGVLGLLGVAALVVYTNYLTLLVGLIGFIDYVVLYGWSKRHSVYGTLVGSISGSAPIVAGYTAVTDRFDLGTLLLFLILTCWQMPHFYAIAIYRYDDYRSAGLPVLPVARSVKTAKLQIVAYIVAFVVATMLLTVFGYAGYSYAVIMAAVGLRWLQLALQGMRLSRKTDVTAWGRRVFLFSLLVILLFSVATALGGRLP